MEIFSVVFWSAIGSVVSLIGGLVLVRDSRLRGVAMRYGLPFGAGALLAAAFLSALPEAMHAIDAERALVYALGGFLSFFMLERLVGWFHHHHEAHHHEADGRSDTTHQWLVVIGDTLHNAIDGAAIGAAFLVNPAAGVGTAIAVAAHEIPQELGDFGILLAKGMRPRRVILVNLLSALATVVTALVVFMLGDAWSLDTAPLLAIAVGFFIYIAASDIIPDIHETSRAEGNRQTIVLLVGLALVATVITALPHEHEHQSAEHGHEDHSAE